MTARERLDEITWATTTDQAALKTYHMMFRWMREATAEIEQLQAELIIERRQRKEADGVLDSMLRDAT